MVGPGRATGSSTRTMSDLQRLSRTASWRDCLLYAREFKKFESIACGALRLAYSVGVKANEVVWVELPCLKR